MMRMRHTHLFQAYGFGSNLKFNSDQLDGEDYLFVHQDIVLEINCFDQLLDVTLVPASHQFNLLLISYSHPYP